MCDTCVLIKIISAFNRNLSVQGNDTDRWSNCIHHAVREGGLFERSDCLLVLQIVDKFQFKLLLQDKHVFLLIVKIKRNLS